MLLSLQKVSRRTVWLRRITILGVLLIGAGGWFAYRPVMNRYRVWKQQRALVQAKDFLVRKDLPNAKLAIDVALTAVPGDPAALRMAATLLEQVGSPEEMPLRRRLVLLAPDSTEDRAALVMAALRFRDLNAARDALADMTPAQADTPVALKAALGYALASDNKPVADAIYDRLKAKEPTNQNLKIMHALLRLKHPRPEIAAAARTELEQLAGETKNTLFIQRELMLDAMTRRDTTNAKRLAALVVAQPGATLADRLHQANLALNTEQKPFAEVFAQLTPHAGMDTASAVELIRWLLIINHAADADRWLATLPPAMQADPVMAALRADIAAALGDWDRLATLLEAGAWGALNKDVIRLALAARVAAERGNDGLQKQLWDEAIAMTGKSVGGLSLLYRLAGTWRWPDQAERCLWAITRAFPSQAWAHQTLFNAYRERGQTENLRSLLGTLRELDDSVPRYKHDWALLTLLVDPVKDWSPPKTMLSELYSAVPTNDNYAVAYAFALAQSDRVAEALAVLEKLMPVSRDLPARSPYLAYIYGMSRRPADYEKAAAMQPQLTRLLPEESRLFDLGREALSRPLPRTTDRTVVKPKVDTGAPKVSPKG